MASNRTSKWQEKQRVAAALAHYEDVQGKHTNVINKGSTLVATVSITDESGNTLDISYEQGLTGIANTLNMNIPTLLKMTPPAMRSIPFYCGAVERYTKDHATIVSGRLRKDGTKVMIGDYVLYTGNQETIDTGCVRWVKNTKQYDRIRKQWLTDLEHGLIPVMNGMFYFDHSVLVTDWSAYVHAVLAGDLFITLNCADSMSRSDQHLAKGATLLNADTRKANTIMHLVISAMESQATYDKLNKQRSDLVAMNRDVPESLDKRCNSALVAATETHGAFISYWNELHLVTIDQNDLSLAVSSVVAGDTVSAQRASHDAMVKKLVDSRGYTITSPVKAAEAATGTVKPVTTRKPAPIDSTIQDELHATRVKVAEALAAEALAAAEAATKAAEAAITSGATKAVKAAAKAAAKAALAKAAEAVKAAK